MGPHTDTEADTPLGVPLGPPAAISPRWLYFWIFGWAATHGRFMALFLEDRGLDEGEIGAVLSITSVISIIAAPALCNYADKIVNNGNAKGYELVLITCIVVTTLVFCLHMLPELGLLNADSSFAYFMVLRVLYSISLAPSFPILDGIALNYLVENGLDKAAFGQQRLYGAYGWAVVSFALGVCIDYFETKIMYLFICVMMVAVVYCLIMFSKSRERSGDSDFDDNVVEMHCQFRAIPTEAQGEVEDDDEEDDEEDEASGRKVLTEMCEEDAVNCGTDGQQRSTAPLLGRAECSAANEDVSLPCHARIQKNPYWIVLSLMMFSPIAIMFVVLHTVLSGVTSIVENLVFLFFKDSLGASNMIMGFSVVVTVVFEIPMFAYSTRFLQIFGQNNLLVIGCIAYCIRVIGYTLAPDGVWVLLAEPLHGVTYASSKMATVDFVSDIAPDHMQATAQGILASLSAIGKLVGTSTGGYIQETYGADALYRGSAVLMLFFLVVFIFVLFRFTNRCSSKENSKPKSVNNALEEESQKSATGDLNGGEGYDI